jgi:hypothetical protein
VKEISCYGEGDGDDYWFGRETKEMGNHGFVGEGQNRWGEAWDLKMGVARGCWFAQMVGDLHEEGTTFVGCWMEKRKACAGSQEQKSKSGRAALFFSF